MSEALPTVSIVIPARPDQAEVKAVAAARGLDYPRDRLEIILARGKQPSVQRNTAVRVARGEIIYFLDDDSLPERGNLRRVIEHFRDPKVQMVGGPNLCPENAPLMERAFSLTMGSWLAFGPSCARYRATGSTRPSSEKELILCNLAARKQSFQDAGGFDEALYPNEENALMDELQTRGGILLYDPQLIVHRRPRSNLKSFLKMLMTYGRGRAEQFRTHPTMGSAPNFVPPLFCIYLIVALIFQGLLLWPLALYAAAVLAQTIALKPHCAGTFLRVTGLIMASHIFYGIGFWRGLGTKLKPPGQPTNVVVNLETISPA